MTTPKTTKKEKHADSFTIKNQSVGEGGTKEEKTEKR